MLFGGTRVPHDGTARVTKIEFTTKQEAHLWQRDRAKLDTLSVNVQRYSQNHAQNWIFLGHPLGHQKQYIRFI